MKPFWYMWNRVANWGDLVGKFALSLVTKVYDSCLISMGNIVFSSFFDGGRSSRFIPSSGKRSGNEFGCAISSGIGICLSSKCLAKWFAKVSWLFLSSSSAFLLSFRLHIFILARFRQFPRLQIDRNHTKLNFWVFQNLRYSQDNALRQNFLVLGVGSKHMNKFFSATR